MGRTAGSAMARALVVVPVGSGLNGVHNACCGFSGECCHLGMESVCQAVTVFSACRVHKVVGATTYIALLSICQALGGGMGSSHFCCSKYWVRW